MTLMAYLSYLVAELFDLSGIVTVFFCGIVMSHYTWHNVTESSRLTTKHSFAALSFIAEVFIFVYAGMDILDMEKWKFVRRRLADLFCFLIFFTPGKSIGVSLILLGLIIVGRAAFVFPLLSLINLSKKFKNEKIHFKQQFTRYGQTQLPGNALMITNTITIGLFCTVSMESRSDSSTPPKRIFQLHPGGDGKRLAANRACCSSSVSFQKPGFLLQE